MLMHSHSDLSLKNYNQKYIPGNI